MWLNIDAGDIQSTDWFSVHAIVRKPCSRTGTRGGNWLIVLWKYPAAESLEGRLSQLAIRAGDHSCVSDGTQPLASEPNSAVRRYRGAPGRIVPDRGRIRRASMEDFARGQSGAVTRTICSRPATT